MKKNAVIIRKIYINMNFKELARTPIVETRDFDSGRHFV